MNKSSLIVWVIAGSVVLGFMVFTVVDHFIHSDYSFDEEDLDSKILIDESIEGLNPLEKAVIENRYKNDYTQEETASRVGLSQAKVSRIESRSKVKIRNFIAS